MQTGVVRESLTRGLPPRSPLCTARVDSDQFSEPGGGGTAAAARVVIVARLPLRAGALDLRTARAAVAAGADRMLACIGISWTRRAMWVVSSTMSDVGDVRSGDVHGRVAFADDQPTLNPEMKGGS